jgi:hypothetical protein
MRFPQVRHILGEKLHFLRHAALDDGVALIQAERQRFAVEDLLTNLSVHQPAHLLRRGRTPPLRYPPRFQLEEVIVRQLDPAAIPLLNRSWVEHAVNREQCQSDQEKVQQRIAQPSSHERGLRLTGCEITCTHYGASHRAVMA